MTRTLRPPLAALFLLIAPAAQATARQVQASEQALAARNDGLHALGASQTSMRSAGLAFDGSGSIGNANAVPQTARNAGPYEGGLRERFAPRLAPAAAPLPPAVEKQRNTTSYQGLVVLAVAGLLLAMLLMWLASRLKKAAEAATDPIQGRLLRQGAANLHLAAAAASAVAFSMGIILATGFGQKGQGAIFTIAGGLLTAYNLHQAVKLYSSSAEDEETEQQVEEGAGRAEGVEQQRLGSKVPCEDFAESKRRLLSRMRPISTELEVRSLAAPGDELGNVLGSRLVP